MDSLIPDWLDALLTTPQEYRTPTQLPPGKAPYDVDRPSIMTLPGEMEVFNSYYNSPRDAQAYLSHKRAQDAVVSQWFNELSPEVQAAYLQKPDVTSADRNTELNLRAIFGRANYPGF